MPLAREQRKLAAIIAADVVGYSRLMGRDESGTLARLRKNRSDHLDPVVTKYGGRLVKLTGDGALMEFASAVDALSAAIEFQQAMAEANRDQPADTALVFRMGLHLGDLIVDGDDLYGDGVNVAARWRRKPRRVASSCPAPSTRPLPAALRRVRGPRAAGTEKHRTAGASLLRPLGCIRLACIQQRQIARHLLSHLNPPYRACPSLSFRSPIQAARPTTISLMG